MCSKAVLTTISKEFKADVYVDTERTFFNDQPIAVGEGKKMAKKTFFDRYTINSVTDPSSLTQTAPSYTGGVIVVGPANTGILFEYRENLRGDTVDVMDVLTAARTLANASARELEQPGGAAGEPIATFGSSPSQTRLEVLGLVSLMRYHGESAEGGSGSVTAALCQSSPTVACSLWQEKGAALLLTRRPVNIL
eukprot:scpid52786/ scgid33394/ 